MFIISKHITTCYLSVNMSQETAPQNLFINNQNLCTIVKLTICVIQYVF